jgi:Tol biopolymer transport system component
VTVLNSSADDTGCDLSPDGLTLRFASARPGGPGGRDIYRSTRPSLDGPWSAPQLVPTLNSPGDDESAVTTEDELTLFFASDRSAPGLELFTAVRASRVEDWGAIAPVAGLGATDRDASPFIRTDALTLFFQSRRVGGRGSIDIWFTTRPSAAAPFTAPTNVAELNGPSLDSDPWLSPDGRTMFFASDRNGTQDIWMAQR